MIPKKQTRLHKGLQPISDRGNCFPACIASIMEVEVEDVIQIQELYDEPEWHIKLSKWLEERGYVWRYATIDEIRSSDKFILVTGESPRFKGTTHVVIYQNGKMIHDPHPDDTGVLDERYFEVIEKQ